MPVKSSHKWDYSIAKHKDNEKYIVCYRFHNGPKWFTLPTEHATPEAALARILELVDDDNKEIGVDYEIVGLSS